MLQPLAGGHTRCGLLGRSLASPLLLAPVAYQTLFHPDGECATALAAAMQGAGYVLSAQAATPLETVAALVRDEPGRGPLWFQFSLLADRGAIRALLHRAEAAGFEALVLTVDAPVHGARDRERRAGFRLPPGVAAVNLPSPQQVSAVSAPPAAGSAAPALCAGIAEQAAQWADLAWLAEATRLPLLLKGVLSPADAVQAAEAGVAGLIVSNHGGRTLDGLPATAEALPRVAEALAARPGPRPLLLIDGGIRRGTDWFKALALGADGVLIGRPAVAALAAGGAPAVALAIRLLRDELEIAMVQAGCATLADIGPDRLWR